MLDIIEEATRSGARIDDTLAALTARSFPVARVEAVDLGRSWTLCWPGGDDPSPAGSLVVDGVDLRSFAGPRR
ncbi:hypothetical protein GCM10010193_32620 [Kitasatospora atroaurantiaca]|uniref:Uncharacterized protein n=1 Tax=Kitasatospora atroaurantiaca TaxID=285545 RepID=A0A561ERN1_9ACTN|nr:hypothetical protein [Kitasatospora atroaurantiaca]TWE18244.1 hypothetical protein FB465_3298 [Kitasatospora atroaurantiaca]